MKPVNFVSVLRPPDVAFGATEASAYRFEEPKSAACDVKYDYTVAGDVADDHIRTFSGDFCGYGLQEVSFTDPVGTVDE